MHPEGLHDALHTREVLLFAVVEAFPPLRSELGLQSCDAIFDGSVFMLPQTVPFLVHAIDGLMADPQAMVGWHDFRLSHFFIVIGLAVCEKKQGFCAGFDLSLIRGREIGDAEAGCHLREVICEGLVLTLEVTHDVFHVGRHVSVDVVEPECN